MKLEDFLMHSQEEHRRRCELEDEVAELQNVLEKEQTLSVILQRALHVPLVSCSSLSSLLPLQVQVLLAELAMVEEEIVYLEGKVKELRLCLYEEGKQTEELKLRRRRGRFSRKLHRNKGFSETLYQPVEIDRRNDRRRRRMIKGRKAQLLKPVSEATSSHSDSEGSKEFSWRSPTTDEKSPGKSPNEISEELVKCLISIFHKLNLNQTSGKSSVDPPAFLPKLSLSCMSSKGSPSKSYFSCKTSTYPSDESLPSLDPYELLPRIYGTAVERGPYRNLVSVTKNSLDIGRMNHCFNSVGKLRRLIHQLRTVDLQFLKYKQKLAFWINVYNACIMNAFLQYDQPSSSEKVLELLNKAALNVSGIVLNALAIEHFILRQPSQSKLEVGDVKDRFIQHSYGLSYLEPNITFALCRGTWSSPALRVYTAQNVTDELERAKIDYLEASIHVTSRRRILLPKLIYWYMKDFADDVDSLIEWVYSQLPKSTPLKKLIMDCLKTSRSQKMGKLVEILPYDPEFRYLLPSLDLSGFGPAS